MALIVLATICFLACAFLLFVLVQWIRDTNRKTTTRPAVNSEAGETRETKYPHIVGPRSAVERRDRFKVRSHQVAPASGRSRGRESGYDERERMAYRRICEIAQTWEREARREE
jgi:hypothetical protein